MKSVLRRLTPTFHRNCDSLRYCRNVRAHAPQLHICQRSSAERWHEHKDALGTVGRRGTCWPQQGVVHDGLTSDAADDAERGAVRLRASFQEGLEVVGRRLGLHPHCRLSPLWVWTPPHSDRLHSLHLREARGLWVPLLHRRQLLLGAASASCRPAQDCGDTSPCAFARAVPGGHSLARVVRICTRLFLRRLLQGALRGGGGALPLRHAVGRRRCSPHKDTELQTHNHCCTDVLPIPDTMET